MDAFELQRIQASAEEALKKLEEAAAADDGAAILNLMEATARTLLRNQAAIAKHLADAPTFTDAFGKPFTGIDSGEA